MTTEHSQKALMWERWKSLVGEQDLGRDSRHLLVLPTTVCALVKHACKLPQELYKSLRTWER